MNIAILGYGVEGESVYNYYHAKFPDAIFTAYDNKAEPKNPLPSGVEFVGGVGDFKGIVADLAIKTPAIPPSEVEVTGEVTTMTREFLKVCPAPVIGVTGTKGKGTTASLIKSILDAAGKKTWLVGNIGTGAFDVLNQISADDIVVYELSSFQLWDADVSPHVAIVLGIEPEHLDVHEDFEDYVRAKSHIASFQTADDTVVYNSANQWSKQIATQSPGEKIPYLGSDGVYVRDDHFYYGEQKLCSTNELMIPGQHNIENACAAIAAVHNWVQDPEIIANGLSSFEGLPFRLQLIRELDDVRYYNDSYSSAPPATRVALNAIDGPIILIVGGYDRGLDYEEFGRSLQVYNSIKTFIVLGQTAPKIIAGLGQDNYVAVESLLGAVSRAHDMAVKGDSVLFSPGCASFDMFKDFNDRGRQFTQLVEEL
jgi:UDP-N-acetylmuramoylalanine--D-glutamate ligase